MAVMLFRSGIAGSCKGARHLIEFRRRLLRKLAYTKPTGYDNGCWGAFEFWLPERHLCFDAYGTREFGLATRLTLYDFRDTSSRSD